MVSRPLRALTQRIWCPKLSLMAYRRNGVPPVEGIDTVLLVLSELSGLSV